LVTIDFGPSTQVDMRDMADVWASVFGSSFQSGFDGTYTPFGIRHETHNFNEYQLDNRDGVNGLDPGSGAAVWFYGHHFDYDGDGRPVEGTTQEIQVYSAADVNRYYETYRVVVYGLDVSLPEAVDIVESENLDPLLEGERLRILGHRLDDFLVGGDQADELFGYGGADQLRGGMGDDFLDGGAGVDRLFGGAGRDTLLWQASDAKVDGGTGSDTLELHNSLNLIGVSNAKIVNVERIDMRGGGSDVLRLNQADVLAMTPGDVLRVTGDFGDVVHRGAGWSDGGIVDGYHVYTQDLATLLVDRDMVSVI